MFQSFYDKGANQNELGTIDGVFHLSTQDGLSLFPSRLGHEKDS